MKILILSSIFVATFTLGAGVGLACTCAPPPAPTEALEEAAAVFSGKVVQIKRHKPAEDIFGGVEVVFRVDRAWKGVAKSSARVFTSSQSAACGYSFSKGQTYLVYAAGNSRGRLSTSICSRTKRLKDAREDLDALGTGKRVATDHFRSRSAASLVRVFGVRPMLGSIGKSADDFSLSGFSNLRMTVACYG